MTTGRINQVAFLMGRRAPPAPPGRPRGGRGRRSLGRGVSWDSDVESSSAACAGSESAARPRAPRDRRGVGGTRGRAVVPRRPFGGVGWRGNSVWPGLLPSKGRQHKNRPVREPYRLKDKPRGSSADSSVAEHGASRQRRSKHHSHARAFLPSRHHRGDHAPRARGRASRWKRREAPDRHR